MNHVEATETKISVGAPIMGAIGQVTRPLSFLYDNDKCPTDKFLRHTSHISDMIG